ncbi:uncharacterized protein [Montipora foliosa]|uniref:uncharacterized protein isoform X1 n=1 Tax=Montipora foliosa TaxID=591990 RepID=UPI0035F1AEF3
MEDETRCVIPKLEDLCAKFIRDNVNSWKPEDFLVIPRHLFFPFLEKLQPLEIERLEISGILSRMGINTSYLWQDMYCSRWPKKRKWPKGAAQDHETWRVYYLQRHMQDAINVNSCTGDEDCSLPAGHEDLQNIISVCGKYATYLRLYNGACIYLAKHWEICQQVAEHVEFLEVFMLRDNGEGALCYLLRAFGAKNLKSVSFSFCRVDSLQIWQNIFSSLLPTNSQTRDCLTCVGKNTENACSVELENETSIRETDKTDMNIMHQQWDHKQSELKTSFTRTGQRCNDTANSIYVPSSQSTEGVNIYDFSDSIDTFLTQSSAFNAGVCDVCLQQSCPTESSSSSDSDLYDDIFSSCACRHRQLTHQLHVRETFKEICADSDAGDRITAESFKLSSRLTNLSNPVFSLKHFELVAVRFQQDAVLEFFLNCLNHCVKLESLTFEDNHLGFVLQKPQLLKKFVNTLSFLCTKGQLQSLKITDNMMDDKASIPLIEKLVASFCLTCNSAAKSLKNLVFSSFLVSAAAFSSCIGRAIRDHCICEWKNNPSTAAMSSESRKKNVQSLGWEMLHVGCEEHYGSDRPGNKSGSNRSITGSTQAGSTFKDKESQHSHFLKHCSGICAEEGNRTNESQSASFGCDTGTKNTNGNSAVIGIQELHLTCMLFDQGASLIADGLQSNCSLYSLSLIDCDISTPGLAGIFHSLTGNQVLKHLNVRGNSYDSSNNDSLARMLNLNKTLTELNLSSCKLGEYTSDFSKNLIHALCMNSTVTCLKLKDNRLGDAHVAALSQVLTHPCQNSRITKLDLRNNPISVESLSALSSSLQCIKPRKLDEVKVTGNILDPKTYQVLSQLRTVVQNVEAEHLDKATLFADFVSQM